MSDNKEINNAALGSSTNPQAQPNLAPPLDSAIRKRAFAAAHSLVRGVQSSRSTSANRSKLHPQDLKKNHQAPRNPRIRTAEPLLGPNQDARSKQQHELFKQRAGESNPNLHRNEDNVPYYSLKPRPASRQEQKAAEEQLHQRADGRAKASTKNDLEAISATPASPVDYIPPEIDFPPFSPEQNLDNSSSEQQMHPWKGLEEVPPAEYEVSLKRKFKDLVVLLNGGLGAVLESGEFDGQGIEQGGGSGGLQGGQKEEEEAPLSGIAAESLVHALLGKLAGNVDALLGDTNAEIRENIQDEMQDAHVAAAAEEEEQLQMLENGSGGGGEFWSIDDEPSRSVDIPRRQVKRSAPSLATSLPQPLPGSDDILSLPSLPMSLSADEADKEPTPGSAAPLSSSPMLAGYESNEDITISSSSSDDDDESLPSDFDIDF